MRMREFTLLSLIVSVVLVLTGTVSAQVPPLSDGRSPVEPGLADSSNSPQQAENVEFVGHIGGATYAVFVQGNYAYIGEGPRLTIVDISNPASPTLAGKTIPLPGLVQDVYVADDYAYVADSEGGLRVVDVSDPANPTEVSSYGTVAEGVAVNGSIAYVSHGYGGLRVVDVSDPANPTEVGVYDTSGYANGVYVSGSTAYVADGQGGLVVVDVSDPANPSGVGVCDTPWHAYGVYVSGSTAYVADGQGGLVVVDVSDPTNPAQIGSYEVSWGHVFDVHVSGSTAYLATSVFGLHIVDVSDPAHPILVGFYGTGGDGEGVYVSGNIAYLADGSAGLTVLDVSDSASPAKLGSYEPPAGWPYGVYISERIAYISDRFRGLRVVDVSDPTTPTEIGVWNTPGNGCHVHVSGNTAYVADCQGGLRVVDVSDPANPTEVGYYNTPGRAYDVYVSGSTAYVADEDGGLRVVDVSNPANPTEIGSYDTPGRAEGVYVSGSLVYIAENTGYPEYDSWLRIVDVSDPASPTEVGFCETPGQAWDVYVSDSTAYVADKDGGLRVVDVSDPANPTEIGSYDTPGEAWGVYVSGSTVYVAGTWSGLRVIDISDPTNPNEVGSYDTPDWASDVYATTSTVYLVDQRGGLLILRYTGAGTTPTLTPTPTPTPSPTPSATPTWTSTPTHTVVPTTTPTPTPTATPTVLPGDPYEPDNTCGTANAIAPNGESQKHTFHIPGDTDWLRFSATAGTDYIISALQAGPDAHPIIRLYAACDQDPFADSGDTFGYDQIISFRAERDGLYYLQLTHRDPDVYGDDTAYQVSVRPGTTGAAVIVGGRLYPNEQLQPQITFMTDRAYHVFRQAGYDDDAIYYMSADANPPPFMDAPSVPANLRYALQTWAPQQVGDGEPLFIYLTDHGEPELFYLDTGQHKVTPGELDRWLLAFEAQRPNSPVVVIIEACQSGSFITPLGSLSRPGRIIVTATGDNNLAYVKPAGEGGAHFSDAFFNTLAQNYDLWQSYWIAWQTVRETRHIGHLQTPWLDGDGDGLPYPLDPDDEGAGRHLGLGRLAALSGQPPFIEPPTLPRMTDAERVLVQVRVLDENPAGATVWMMVTRPSTPPPSPPPGYITPVSHAERVELWYNGVSGLFEVELTLDEMGEYQLVLQAEDSGGQQAQAVNVKLRRGPWQVYLPAVIR